MRTPLALLTLLLVFAVGVLGWDNQDHEIFDLVSELEGAEGKGTTFYSFLNVTKSATLSEINKASRRRGLELHPDKNRGIKNIEERFARLGVITAILRDEEKRKRYNYFHDNGVPKWKGTGYMYSRWQPGLLFALSFILLVSTLSQYAVQSYNHRAELARIRKFQKAARQVAYRNNSSKVEDVKRKQVKVPLAAMRSGEVSEGDDEPSAPANRATKRRTGGGAAAAGGGGSKQGQSALVTMVVEGDKVWIVTEDGVELPLDKSAASPASLSNTFIPSAFRSLLSRFTTTTTTPKPDSTTEATDGGLSVDEGGSGSVTPVGDGSGNGNGTRKRKGGKGKK